MKIEKEKRNIIYKPKNIDITQWSKENILRDIILHDTKITRRIKALDALIDKVKDKAYYEGCGAGVSGPKNGW